MHELVGSAKTPTSQRMPRSTKAIMKLREEAADFTSTMVLRGILTGLMIMITYTCIGATAKDGEGKLDVCEGGKYVYAGVWTFAIFVYGFLLLGLVLPYFGLPLWLTCGYEFGGFMPTALEELEGVYGKEVPFAVGIYHAARHMGTCLRQGRDIRKVAVTSLVGLVALLVVAPIETTGWMPRTTDRMAGLAKTGTLW
ncbi:hypothetical protein LTR86_006038 [Recurvomyces mirabilis]|nr:hypothetical protein LTR86_006038 [Recurvomyces mirabilis]